MQINLRRINWDPLFRFAIIAIAVMMVFVLIKLYKDESRIERSQYRPTPVPSPSSGVVPSVTPTPNRHAHLIKAIQEKAETRLSQLVAINIAAEGVRTTPYLDSKGNVTIGVGRNLTGLGISITELFALVPNHNHRHLLRNTHIRNDRVYIEKLAVAEQVFFEPLTADDISLLLTDDLHQVEKEAMQVFGGRWQQIDAIRREAILNVMFNLGLPRFKEFERTIGHIKKGEWQQAASELLLSQAARQNAIRYHRAAMVLQTGDPSYFDIR